MVSLTRALHLFQQHDFASKTFHGFLIYSPTHRTLIETFRSSSWFKYSALPLEQPDVAGGIFGAKISGKQILCIEAQPHWPDAERAHLSVLGVRIAKKMGLGSGLILGAGQPIGNSDNSEVGMIADQINLTGSNPLIGHNDSEFGPRFPDMTSVYSPEIQKDLEQIFREKSIASGRKIMVAVPPEKTSLSEEQKAALHPMEPYVIMVESIYEAIIAGHTQLSLGGLAVVHLTSSEKLSGLIMTIVERIF